MRSEQLGPLDTPLVPDGDGAFVGFRSRVQGAALPPGVAQYLQNMRCDRGTARPRKGLEPLSTDIDPGSAAALEIEFETYEELSINSMTRSSSTVTCTRSDPHSMTTGDWVVIAGAVETDYNGDWQITVTGVNTFTFDIGAATPTTPATGTITSTQGELILDIYDSEVRASCPYATAANVEGIVLCLGATAYIYIEGVASAEIAYPSGEVIAAGQKCAVLQFLSKVYLFRDGDNGLEWDLDPASDFVAVPSGAHASGGTFIKMPDAAWGAHATRRMVLPYGRDELILSSFGDADTYDTQYGQLRIMPGTRDWLVGADNYERTRILVLYRYSLHLVSLSETALEPTAIDVVTRQFGCAARRSVQLCDDRILLLSDNGVKALEFTGELNLKPAATTFSDNVQDLLERINWTERERICSIYWQNRYYLALPLDGADRCRHVLVFNFLNREWESLDTFPGDMDVQDLHVIDKAGAKRLHVTTSYGFVFLYEENSADSWASANATPADYPIAGQLLTRRYLAQVGYDRKAFKSIEVQLTETLGDALTITLEAHNPDLTQAVLSHTAQATGGSTLRARPRARGVSAAVQIDTTAGRPEIRALTLAATVPGSDQREKS